MTGKKGNYGGSHMTAQLDMEMQAMATFHGVGQHGGLLCPSCDSTERSLSLKVGETGEVSAICHRASCGFKYADRGMRIVPTSSAARTLRPYTGAIEPLAADDFRWFHSRFKLDVRFAVAIKRSDGRYMLPIVAAGGERRGWISRRPWDGSPLSIGHEGIGHLDVKALTYMELDGPGQSWYGLRGDTAVLVEDQISAMRVAQDTGLQAVSILGTGVNEEKVAEIQGHAKHVLIALDRDATGQAFSIARKWGMSFKSCRVIILSCDIKDMKVEDVKRLLS